MSQPKTKETMAEETKQPKEDVQHTAVPRQPQQQPQQPQPRPCPQDCRLCGMNQQLFCTTKMLFSLSSAFQETRQQISLLELAIDDIKEQLQPKKDETELSIPFADS